LAPRTCRTTRFCFGHAAGLRWSQANPARGGRACATLIPPTDRGLSGEAIGFRSGSACENESFAGLDVPRAAFSERWTLRTGSRVRAADPLSPGSTETSRRRSQAGTGTRPCARVRGRRSCLGRPRGPERARDRASTRGRLRASNPHRMFPVLEDHHDRGARSPRPCDHSKARGRARSPRVRPAVKQGEKFRAVERPCIFCEPSLRCRHLTSTLLLPLRCGRLGSRAGAATRSVSWSGLLSGAVSRSSVFLTRAAPRP
jgi:hypothetical protein